jgi:hypothetical protein
VRVARMCDLLYNCPEFYAIEVHTADKGAKE